MSFKQLFQNKIFFKKVAMIALPIALQNFIVSTLNMVDTIMIGKLGETQIAAVGAANKLFFLFNLLLFGVNSGAAIFVAQFYGKKDFESIKKIIWICLIGGVVGAIPFSLIALLAPEFFLNIFNGDIGVVENGAIYLRTIGASYIVTAIYFAFMFALRSIGRVKPTMVFSGIAVAINIVLNYALIFGNFGMPKMGVQGAALATLIARCVELSILLIYVYAKKLEVAINLKSLYHMEKDLVSRYLKTSLPVIGNEMLWAVGVTIYAVVFGYMGKDVLAATTITQTVEQMSMVLIFGFGNACAVMLGHELGADNFEVAEDYAHRFVILGPLFAIFIGTALALSSPYIVRLFNVSDTVRSYVIANLIVLSIVMPAKVFNIMNIVGVLRSGGDTMFTMILDFVGVWGVGVPLGIISAVVFKLPIYYVYPLVLCEEVFKMIFGIPRYRSKKWVRNVVN